MGLDARVGYTKRAIRDVFFSLLREKNVKQITLTELCALADINRATFYKHYRDVFDLLEQIEAEALEYLRDTTRQVQGEDAMGRFVCLLERAREHHEEFVVIASENGDGGGKCHYLPLSGGRRQRSAGFLAVWGDAAGTRRGGTIYIFREPHSDAGVDFKVTY